MAPTIVSDHSPPNALLTEVQAAALLSVQPSTLAAWRATKRVSQPKHCRIGGAVRYRLIDIQSYIEASVQPGDS